jgi:site-specific DNA-methyltransferase (adenine-specific)
MSPYASGKRWTLYAGDCLAALGGGMVPPDAAIVSDPPYGMGWDTDCSRFSRATGETNCGATRLTVAGDDQPFDPAPWLCFDRVVLFGANHFGQRLPVGTTLLWMKRRPAAYGSFLSDAEIAWMKGGHGVYAFYATHSQPDREHPCQKPAALMEWCIGRAGVPDGGVVVDPYAGSASTGVAALRTGRRFIGIEREPAYLPIAARRLAQAENDGVPLSLFGGAA